MFYEAYRDKRLTELVADSEDKHGIKRILSAMSAFAPHVIQIRETSGGSIDLAPIITDATHRILQARINGEGVDFTAQGDMFSSNPATEMVTNFQPNVTVAAMPVLRPFAEQVENVVLRTVLCLQIWQSKPTLRTLWPFSEKQHNQEIAIAQVTCSGMRTESFCRK